MIKDWIEKWLQRMCIAIYRLNCDACIVQDLYCIYVGSYFPNFMKVWPGFPSGVKFDPSDQEILEHLAARVGISSAKPHPFISEFIPTINVEGGICYTHPEKLPGSGFFLYYLLLGWMFMQIWHSKDRNECLHSVNMLSLVNLSKIPCIDSLVRRNVNDMISIYL